MSKEEAAETLSIEGREVRVTHPHKPYFSKQVKLSKIEIVRYYLEDVVVKGAWSGPAALQLAHHALAPVADLPVREVTGAVHILTDLTLGLGKVVFDYLKD